MSSLVVPIVVWSGGNAQSCPTHRISTLILTPDCSSLISGSTDGHIILWDLNLETASLEPRSVLLGHTAQVTALCISKDPNSPISKNGCALGGPMGTFLSASENGDLCLWDIEDGRCLEVNKFTGHHIGMQRLPVREQTGIRVLLYGYYNDIYVVDGSSLSHLYTLSSKMSPDWISAVTVVRPIIKAGQLKVRVVDSPEQLDGRKRPTLKQMTAADEANEKAPFAFSSGSNSEFETEQKDAANKQGTQPVEKRVRKRSDPNAPSVSNVGSTNNDLAFKSAMRKISAHTSLVLSGRQLPAASAAQNLQQSRLMWTSDSDIEVQSNTASYVKVSLLEVPKEEAEDASPLFENDYFPSLMQKSSRKKQPTHVMKSSQKANQRIVYRQLIRGKDVVVALTLSGHVKVWSVSPTDRKEMEFIPEEQSKSIRCMNPCYMTCCAANQKLLLMITESHWYLYDLDDFVKLCGGVSPPTNAQLESHSTGTGHTHDKTVRTWCKGAFLTVDKIAVWTKQGLCVTYQLPSEVNPEHKRYRSKLDSSKDVIVQIIASFDAHRDFVRNSQELLDENEDYGEEDVFEQPKRKNVTTELLPETVATSEFSGMGFVFATGSEEGHVAIHVLPNNVLSQSYKHYQKHPDLIKIPTFACTSLGHVWDKFKPSGLVEHLVDESGVAHKVTSSLYLSQYGNLACGREDGSIVLIPAIEHAALKLLAPQYSTQLGLPSYFVMRGGHCSRVTCLLYPFQESPRYDRSLFVSGSVDFSVVIWNLLNGLLIRRFVNHAGQVERLFIPPDSCCPRIKQCVVSVGSDHGVNLTSLTERSTILIAGCHLFPVKTVKWKPSHDFMLVETTDGTLYVWHLSSGYLDRVIQGSEAEDILSACDEAENEVSIRGNLRDAFKRRNVDALKDMALQQLTDLALHERGFTGSGDASSRESFNRNFNGLNICPIRLSPKDSFFHVLFFDTESLVIELLNCDKRRPSISPSVPPSPVPSEKFKMEFERLEQVRRLTQSGSNFSDKVSKFGNKILENVKKEIVLTSSGSTVQGSIQSSNGSSATLTRRESGVSNEDVLDFETPEIDPVQQEAEQEQLTCEIAQLMMSLLFAWDLNPTLDKLCLDLLGLFRPNEDVCFGVSSRPGYLTLCLPSSRKLASRHWALSSSLTTQHRLAITTLANALMSMRVPILAQKLLSKIGPNVYPEILQGWSSVAALHCVLFPDLAPSDSKPADLEQLVRRWQDRCLEVREAAHALLLAELKHVGVKGRQTLVDIWASHLPLLSPDSNVPSSQAGTSQTPYSYGTSANSTASSVASSSPKHVLSASPNFSPQMSENVSESQVEEDEDSLAVSSNVVTQLGSNVASTTPHFSRQETQKRQGTAIVMLGVLGAEFGQSVMNNDASALSDSAALEGFSGTNTSLARYTCQALTFLLLHPPPVPDKQYGELRRAAIHLLGRGFTVWEPYMDITKVILALLELASDTKVDYDVMFNGMPMLPEVDLLQSTHYALTQVATTRPSLFITSLAREIARFSALIAAAPTQGTLSNMPSAVLARSKTEILRNVEILMETQHYEVENLLLETMDIVIHCLDPGVLKNKMLKNVFPACQRFLNIDHCPTSRRVAAGGKRSIVHLYDSRALRPQLIQGPDEEAKISCLCFSPDGRYLATFIAELGKIMFWQASSSFFNMLAANSFRMVKIAECPRLSLTTGPTIKGRRFVTQRMVIILLSDGKEFRFTL